MLTIFYVYLLFDFCGIPRYIGKGKDSRWLDHEREGGKHTNRRLRKLILEAHAIGRMLPKIKLLEDLTEEEAFAHEIMFITAIGRGIKGPLFNQTDGGDGPSGYVFTTEDSATSSAGQKRRFARLEEREKLSIRKKGVPLSSKAKAAIAMAMKNGGTARAIKAQQAAYAAMTPDERKAKFGAHNKGRKRSTKTTAKQKANNPGNTGHQHSDETKARLSVAATNQMSDPRQRAMRAEISRNRVISDETRKRLSESIRASWARRSAAHQFQLQKENCT